MRVCFSAPYAYPLFDPRDRSPIGGAETRAWLFARGLRRQGVQVDVLVQAPRCFTRRSFDGIKVWNTGDGFDTMRHRVADWWSPPPGCPPVWRTALLWEVPCLALVKLVRRLYPGRSLATVLPQVDADCYCVLGVSSRSAEVVRLARQIGRPAVLFLASNDDLHEQFVPGSTYRTPYGEQGSVCGELLATAAAIVTQTEEQQQLLQQRFGRTGVLLRSPFDITGWDADALRDSPVRAARRGRPYLLWVGRADRFHKRPQLCLELARRCPEAEFVMVVNRGEPAVADELRSRRPQNVQIVEQVAFHEMPALMSGALAFISTSSRQYEGAPNVFLQAVASRVPVLSLDVPGNLLNEVRAGVVCDGDMERLAAAVRQVWCDEHLRAEWGRQGREFLTRFHDLDTISQQLRATLEAVVGSRCVSPEQTT